MVKHRLVLFILMALFSVNMVLAGDKAMTDSIHHIEEVVVTGTRSATDIRHLSQTVTVVGHTKLTENYRQNVLPTLMEQVPGLMLTSRGMMGYGVSTGAAGGLMIRGISSGTGQVMVLIDGHPQYNGIYGHSIADAYQTMMTDHVEVLRGPSSLLYGSNAMGGVINIVTRGSHSPQKKESEVYSGVQLGAGSYGTVQAEGYNIYRRGRFSSTVSAQYSRTDNHRSDMGFEQYGGYVKLGYDISSNWDIMADADITHFTSSNPGTVTEPKVENDQWITRYALNLVVSNHYRNLHTSNGIPVITSGALSVYDNFGRHKINDGYNPLSEQPKSDLFRSKDALRGVSIYQNVTYQWSNPLTITAGFDWQNIYGKAWYTSRFTDEVVTTKQRLMQSCDNTENEYAGYLQLRQDVLRIITLDAGLRIDHHTVAGTELIPQFGIAIRPVSTGQLKLSVSKGFRNPNTKDMFLYGTANSDSLHAERLWNYEIAWRQQFLDGRLTYGINVFYTEADNIIQAVNKRNINTGHLYNSGAELDLSWQIDNHWSVNTNHSYLHMTNPVVSAPTYKGYLGADWQYSKWKFCAGLTQVSGLYTATGNQESKTSFTLLNATVSYQLLKALRLWMKGDNLLAQRYEILSGMPMPRATFMAGAAMEF